MSVGYRAVQWSPPKRRYDAAMVALATVFIATYAGVTKWVFPAPASPSDEIVLIRGLGACAFFLLHVILAIGPLARLWPRALPLLFNRRHLGVFTFLLAAGHAGVVLGFYHGFGVVNPLRSLLTSNQQLASLATFPFEWLGLLALLVLFAMAATSHDYWLKVLSARVWKTLHMSVYVAYALLVGHVALGALQAERGPGAFWAVLAGLIVLTTLHLLAGLREVRRDDGRGPGADGWLDAGPVRDLPMDRARIVCAHGGERIAVFRHAGGVSAVTNVCAHQGGPLGEGRVIDGCITCPWHGWQYRPADGCAPPPFVERVATYPVRITAGRVEVLPRPLAPGTPVPPARVDGETTGAAHG